MFNGKIVIINQNSFHNPSFNASLGASIPIIDHSQLATENVGVGMYPFVMGTFSCLALVLIIGYSLGRASNSLNLISFHTTHMEYPWILSSPSTSSMPIET